MKRGIDRLRDEGVRVRDKIGEQRTECPKCKGGKTSEVSLAVQVRRDSVIWVCHRGTCGYKGAFFDGIDEAGGGLRRNEADQRADTFRHARIRWASAFRGRRT